MNRLNDKSFENSHIVSPSYRAVGGNRLYWFAKRALDILVALVLLPLVLLISVILLIVNPFFNKGPLFYTQARYGRDLSEFRMWKFRTMTGSSKEEKFATDEISRIPPLGEFLRSKHIDELPQIINILKGDMSLIGPRPEQRRFVNEYLETINDYSDRHLIRPGVTGLAQVEQGYTDSADGTRSKLEYDLEYISKSSFNLEWSIIGKTFKLIIRRFLQNTTQDV